MQRQKYQFFYRDSRSFLINVGAFIGARLLETFIDVKMADDELKKTGGQVDGEFIVQLV